MVTTEYCEICRGWRVFNREGGKHERPDLPWYCVECGWGTITFPKYENPITWVLTGKRPPSLIKEE